MSRNELCPCGSGKKFKKCHGAANKPTTAVAVGQATSPQPPASRAVAPAETETRPWLLFKHDRRRPSVEKVEEERRKHLRHRSRSNDLRGTLVYNTDAAFRPREGR